MRSSRWRVKGVQVGPTVRVMAVLKRELRGRGLVGEWVGGLWVLVRGWGVGGGSVP